MIVVTCLFMSQVILNCIKNRYLPVLICPFKNSIHATIKIVTCIKNKLLKNRKWDFHMYWLSTTECIRISFFLAKYLRDPSSHLTTSLSRHPKTCRPSPHQQCYCSYRLPETPPGGSTETPDVQRWSRGQLDEAVWQRYITE